MMCQFSVNSRPEEDKTTMKVYCYAYLAKLRPYAQSVITYTDSNRLQNFNADISISDCYV